VSVFVKICGLRDALCVAAAVDAGADAVGFVFADSVRRASPEEANIASREIPEHVQRVAVMRHPTNDQWQSVLEEFAPDVLQTDAEDFAGLEVPDNIVRWPVIREGCTTKLVAHADVFVYEGKNSGVGETVDWSRAADMAELGRMILAGGLAANNVALAIRAARPWGVDVSSGVESSPGQKDIGLIRQFVSAARAAERYE
jgi:phosphoribosylanthranilate isomerase